MTSDDLKALRRGDILHVVEELDGERRVFEYRLDQAKLTGVQLEGTKGSTSEGKKRYFRGLPKTIILRRTMFRGQKVKTSGIHHVSASDLAQFARTPEEAIALHLKAAQAWVRRVEGELETAREADAQARKWADGWSESKKIF